MDYRQTYAEIMRVYKRRRKAMKLTLQDIADGLEVTKGTVHNFESGYGHPSLKNFIKWSWMLKISLGDIDTITGHSDEQE